MKKHIQNQSQTLQDIIPYNILYMIILVVGVIATIWGIVKFEPLAVAGVMIVSTLTALVCLLGMRKAGKFSTVPIDPACVVLGLYSVGVFVSAVYYCTGGEGTLLHIVSRGDGILFEILFKTSLLHFFGIGVFIVVYLFLPFFWPKKDLYPSSKIMNLSVSNALFYLGAGLSFIGLLGMLQYLRVRGGLMAFMQTWNNRDEVYQIPLIDQVMYLLPLGALFIGATPLKRSYRLLIFVVIIVLSLFALYSTGGRHQILRFLGALFVLGLFNPIFRAFFYRHWKSCTFLFLGLFIWIFISVALVRGAAGARMSGGGNLIQDAAYLFRESDILDRIGSAYYLPGLTSTSTAIYTFPDVYPYLYGDSLLAAADVYLPSFIFKNLPDTRIGKILRSSIYMDDADSGTYASYIGEWYGNFSWLGVAVGMALLAVLSRFLLFYIMQTPRCPFRRTVYSAFLGLLYPMLLIVNVLPAFKMFLPYALGLVVVGIGMLPFRSHRA